MIVVPGLMPLIVITIGTYNYTSTLNLIQGIYNNFSLRNQRPY